MRETEEGAEIVEQQSAAGCATLPAGSERCNIERNPAVDFCCSGLIRTQQGLKAEEGGSGSRLLSVGPGEQSQNGDGVPDGGADRRLPGRLLPVRHRPRRRHQRQGARPRPPADRAESHGGGAAGE